MKNKQQTIFRLMVVVTTGVIFLSACATVTPKKIHQWGTAGEYDLIRQALRERPERDVRIASAIELGKGKWPWAIPELVLLSQDPDEEVRRTAVEGLGHYWGAEACTAIIQRTGDVNSQVSRTAAKVLERWGAQSIHLLLEALEDPNYKVRVAAIRVLGRIDDPRVGPAACRQAQRDDNSMVRREAVRAVGAVGHEPCRSVLHRIKSADTSSEVRLIAESALAKFSSPMANNRTLVVLPVKVSDAQLEPIAQRLARSLGSGLLEANLCSLTSAPSVDWEGEGAAIDRAVAAAKEAGAAQVVYGTARRDGNRVRVSLTRLEVEGRRIMQQEEIIGYETRSDEWIRKLVRKFISRFR